mmetsp:Transcript_5303/g.11499  ORF Transcript_5303/g.11499 Transcript_5303/m.11499 type:complete len:246 (+) Transcript_5303:104-841(+)
MIFINSKSFTGFGSRPLHPSHELLHLVVILNAWTGLDATRHVHAPRPHFAHCIPYVLRSQPPGNDNGKSHVLYRLRNRPVERLARTAPAVLVPLDGSVQQNGDGIGCHLLQDGRRNVRRRLLFAVAPQFDVHDSQGGDTEVFAVGRLHAFRSVELYHVQPTRLDRFPDDVQGRVLKHSNHQGTKGGSFQSVAFGHQRRYGRAVRCGDAHVRPIRPFAELAHRVHDLPRPIVGHLAFALLREDDSD